MAKKQTKKSQPKRLSRTSSMEKCVQDARSFLEAGKKKRILKTRTMARTISDAPAALTQPRRPISHKPSERPAQPPKAAKKSASTKKTTSVKVPPISPIYPAPSQPLKKTVFKTASKDNLSIPAYGFIDVCFCIDATGSMSSQLAQAQSTIEAIITKIENKVRTEGITLRFAIVTYRDHPPQDLTYVTLIHDFTDGYEAIKYVKTLQALGGGDEPQAVHDGLLDCCQKLKWVELPGTPTLRYIFHIADACGHGIEFNTSDPQKGCLCGITTEQVMHEINIRQIHYRLIKVRTNEKLLLMEKIFKEGIIDFASAQIGTAGEMDIRVSDMIIREVAPM